MTCLINGCEEGPGIGKGGPASRFSASWISNDSGLPTKGKCYSCALSLAYQVKEAPSDLRSWPRRQRDKMAMHWNPDVPRMFDLERSRIENRFRDGGVESRNPGDFRFWLRGKTARHVVGSDICPASCKNYSHLQTMMHDGWYRAQRIEVSQFEQRVTARVRSWFHGPGPWGLSVVRWQDVRKVNWWSPM